MSDENIGRGVIDSPDFMIIDCDCLLADIEHLKLPLMSSVHVDNTELRRRKFSLDMLPVPYRNELMSLGRVTVPLGIVIANQRIKT